MEEQYIIPMREYTGRAYDAMTASVAFGELVAKYGSCVIEKLYIDFCDWSSGVIGRRPNLNNGVVFKAMYEMSGFLAACNSNTLEDYIEKTYLETRMKKDIEYINTLDTVVVGKIYDIFLEWLYEKGYKNIPEHQLDIVDHPKFEEFLSSKGFNCFEDYVKEMFLETRTEKLLDGLKVVGKIKVDKEYLVPMYGAQNCEKHAITYFGKINNEIGEKLHSEFCKWLNEQNCERVPSFSHEIFEQQFGLFDFLGGILVEEWMAKHGTLLSEKPADDLKMLRKVDVQPTEYIVPVNGFNDNEEGVKDAFRYVNRCFEHRLMFIFHAQFTKWLWKKGFKETPLLSYEIFDSKYMLTEFLEATELKDWIKKNVEALDDDTIDLKYMDSIITIDKIKYKNGGGPLQPVPEPESTDEPSEMNELIADFAELMYRNNREAMLATFNKNLQEMYGELHIHLHEVNRVFNEKYDMLLDPNEILEGSVQNGSRTLHFSARIGDILDCNKVIRHVKTCKELKTGGFRDSHPLNDDCELEDLYDARLYNFDGKTMFESMYENYKSKFEI